MNCSEIKQIDADTVKPACQVCFSDKVKRGENIQIYTAWLKKKLKYYSISFTKWLKLNDTKTTLSTVFVLMFIWWKKKSGVGREVWTHPYFNFNRGPACVASDSFLKQLTLSATKWLADVELTMRFQ